jgi:hypothetical protein
MTTQNANFLATGPDKSGNYKNAGRGQAPYGISIVKERIPSRLDPRWILGFGI